MTRLSRTLTRSKPTTESMTRIQLYLPDAELSALRQVASRTGRKVAHLVREAIRQTWLRSRGRGPVALWDGKPKRSSVDHDSIYDKP